MGRLYLLGGNPVLDVCYCCEYCVLKVVFPSIEKWGLPSVNSGHTVSEMRSFRSGCHLLGTVNTPMS